MNSVYKDGMYLQDPIPKQVPLTQWMDEKFPFLVSSNLKKKEQQLNKNATGRWQWAYLVIAHIMCVAASIRSKHHNTICFYFH